MPRKVSIAKKNVTNLTVTNVPVVEPVVETAETVEPVAEIAPIVDSGGPSVIDQIISNDYASSLLSQLPAEKQEPPNPSSTYEYLMGVPKPDATATPVTSERSDEVKFALRALREYRIEFPKLKIANENDLQLKSDEDILAELERARGGTCKIISYETVKEGYLQLAYLAELTAPAIGMDLTGFKLRLSNNESINDALRSLTCEMRARITSGIPWWLTLPALTVAIAGACDASNKMEKRANEALSRPVKKLDLATARKHVDALTEKTNLAIEQIPPIS